MAAASDATPYAMPGRKPQRAASLWRPALLALLALGGCALQPPAPLSTPARLEAGAIASPDRYGARTAEQILDAGGNAVDAAVGVAFTLAVTLPCCGNIGGGGFMTVWMDGKPYFLDYRETAPAAATPTMYLDAQGNVVPRLSLDGARAVAVPGTVAGMWEAQRRFGRLSWQQVLAPAIGYARNGFTAYATAEPTSSPARANFNAYFGGRMTAGALFRQPELAETLQRISDDGRDGFYAGRTADLIVAEMARRGGLVTREDLRHYRAVWREPIRIDWNGVAVYTAPPPSSGGVGIGQLLKMKSDLASRFAAAPLNSAEYIQLTAEMEKRVFADRAQYLGDPDYYQVPVARLLDDAYLARRAADVNPDVPTPLAQIRPGLGTAPIALRADREQRQTTHYSIVDRWGNAVANTYTINGAYGSGLVVEGAGFLLNNEMDDFASKPGVPNQFGVVGGDVNSVQPGKRPLSSMSPTIVARDGKVALVLGTPGGSRIFTAVYQVLVDVLDYKLPLAQAQAEPRFHHQLLPDNVIYYEAARFPPSVTRNLEVRGWIMHDGLGGGENVQAIQIVGRDPRPVSDPRNPDGVGLVVPPKAVPAASRP